MLDVPDILSVFACPSCTGGGEDDHDVLVLQLGGTKRWRVWPPRGSGGDGGEGGIDENNKNNKNNNPTNLTTDELPRLYAPRPAPAGYHIAF